MDKDGNHQKLDKNKRVLLIVAVAIVLFILFLAGTISGQKPQRSESYKDASGAAGLSATIDYPCDDPCDDKFGFNIYMFNQSGQQISVVRPDKDGQVNMALAEGNYTMLIGKPLGGDKQFPQEQLELKNGQSLEVELNYR